MRKILSRLILVIVFLSICISFVFAGYVNGYYKSNGTYVNGYYRSDANDTVTDNYSYKGNYNPYNGSTGSNYYRSSPSSQYYNGSSYYKYKSYNYDEE